MHTIDGGVIAHQLTTEERRKGALRAAETKREQSKSVRQRFADKLQEEADSVYAAFRAAWDSGDWRAAQAAMHEAFGKPVETVNVDTTLTVQVEEARDQLAARAADIAVRRRADGSARGADG